MANLRSDRDCFLPTTLTTLKAGWKQTIWRICNLIFRRSVHSNEWTGNSNKVGRQSWYRAPLSGKFSFWHSGAQQDSCCRIFFLGTIFLRCIIFKRLQRFTVRVRKLLASVIRLGEQEQHFVSQLCCHYQSSRYDARTFGKWDSIFLRSFCFHPLFRVVSVVGRKQWRSDLRLLKADRSHSKPIEVNQKVKKM